MKSKFMRRFLSGISIVPLTALTFLMSPVSSFEAEAGKIHRSSVKAKNL